MVKFFNLLLPCKHSLWKLRKLFARVSKFFLQRDNNTLGFAVQEPKEQNQDYFIKKRREFPGDPSDCNSLLSLHRAWVWSLVRKLAMGHGQKKKKKSIRRPISTSSFIDGIKTIIIGYNTIFVVQSPSHVWLFETPWTAAHQASLSFTNSSGLLKLRSTESVMDYIVLHIP